MALPKENRLIRKKDFDQVFASGESFSLGSIAIRFGKSTAHKTRIGVVVPAKSFKRAVDRNRTKRVILEAVRDNLGAFPLDIDLVIMVRPMFKEMEAQDLVKRLVDRLGKIKPKDDGRYLDKNN